MTESGFIMGMRVGKHPDKFLAELLVTTEGKTNCKVWCTDDWGGYERIFSSDITHIIRKENTQWLERTNGMYHSPANRSLA
ncbi:MAG: hypothetical protein HC796_11390 [Synechococcaceae cyanobacterium RL_1_2]|nr:hypothetical protein [Synechococcaceae cyanobacterium RL_1_2]